MLLRVVRVLIVSRLLLVMLILRCHQIRKGRADRDARVQRSRRYEVMPVFDYIANNNINVDNFVYFSDMGIFDYPEKDVGYPSFGCHPISSQGCTYRRDYLSQSCLTKLTYTSPLSLGLVIKSSTTIME